MAKKGGVLLGIAALFGTAAVIISKLEKKAKQEGKDIGDVAKDSINNVVDSVKSGRAVENSKEYVNKKVEDIKSGKFVEDAKDAVTKAYEDVKSGKILNEVNDIAVNAKDGVMDIINSVNKENDGDEIEVEPEVEEEFDECDDSQETARNDERDVF